MKLDLLYELQMPKPWPTPQSRGEHRVYRNAIEQIKLADELGFDTVWMVEHHFREERSHCSAPEIFLGALVMLSRLNFNTERDAITSLERIGEQLLR